MDVLLEKTLKHTVIPCYFKFYFRQKKAPRKRGFSSLSLFRF